MLKSKHLEITFFGRGHLEKHLYCIRFLKSSNFMDKHLKQATVLFRQAIFRRRKLKFMQL